MHFTVEPRQVSPGGGGGRAVVLPPGKPSRAWKGASLTTRRPEGRGFQPSPAGVPVSPPTAPGGPGVSYVSSAGRNGKTCRQDVLRGVDVPVMPSAAGRALPRPGTEAQGREQVPARRARLAGRVPPIDHDQATSGALAFVLQLAAELAP